MTATSITTDAETYATYIANGESKAAAARLLGIGASTVADRVKRHQARQAADAAADETAEVPAAQPPAGIDAADQAAYQIECRSDGCGAQPGEPCITLNRSDERVPMGYAHPKRVDAAGARPVPAPQADPETGEAFHANLAVIATVDPDLADALENADAAEHHDHGDTPADTAGPTGEDKVTECTECGFRFPRPQRRQTCKSQAACDRRKAERAAA